ncbi:MAG: sortase [Chloroflexota bacterium]
MRRSALRWLSNGLIALGIAILLATGGVYGYSTFEQAQAERQAASLKPAIPDAWTPGPAPTETSTAVAVAAVDSGDPRSDTFVPYPRRVEAGAPSTPTAVPTPAPAERIVAPTIHLDAVVKEAPIVKGEWEIPKFAAGHLAGTAQPLQGNNVILAGHVESISSGDVFANLDRLKTGDVIRLYTAAAVVSYKVERVETVSNDDTAVLQPTPREVLTLITCAGAWLPLEHDYTQRTVVIASRAA